MTVPAPATSDRDDRRQVRVWNAIHRLHAAYEASLPRDDLWQLASNKDADASLLPEVRRVVRSRARYEAANNSLLARIIEVYINDVVGGVGPALWMHSGSTTIDRYIEESWEQWWNASSQAAKLSTACRAETVDGEAIGVITSNPRLLRYGPWTTDVVGLECDRLASPHFENANRENYIDGVHLDAGTREAVAYDLLKAHPGTEYLDVFHKMFEAITYPADAVLHAFHRRRAEQHRGLCRYTPVLPVSGLHRKYLEADVNRAQLRAAFAFLLKSMASGEDEDDTSEDGWWSQMQLPNRQGAGVILPEGYEPVQLSTDGAAQDLEQFHRIIAALAGGCFSMPVGLALGLYPTASYPGVRAEMQPYHDAITVARKQIWEPRWLRPLYAAWIQELLLTTEFQRLLQASPALVNVLTPRFVWPGQQLVVDPSREETAKKTRMATGQSNRELENPGTDYDAQDRRSAELAGVDLATYRRMVAQSIHGVPAEVVDPDAESDSDDPDAPPADASTETILNGAQVTVAIAVVQQVQAGTLTSEAGQELLLSLGFRADKARRMVKAKPAKPMAVDAAGKPLAPGAADSEPPTEDPPRNRGGSADA